MRVIAAVLIGLLIGCLVIVGLWLFSRTVAHNAEQWARQSPPPPLTLERRLLLRAANFIAAYIVFLAPVIFGASVGATWFAVARHPHKP